LINIFIFYNSMIKLERLKPDIVSIEPRDSLYALITWNGYSKYFF